MSITQGALAGHFRNCARWRLEKEAKYGDPRDGAAAESLQALADYVASLPDNDCRIRAIMATGWDMKGGLEEGLVSSPLAASSIGFDEHVDDLEQTFTRYVGWNLSRHISQLKDNDAAWATETLATLQGAREALLSGIE